MANGILILPDDSANTGKKLQAFDNTIGTNLVYAEGVTLVDSSGTEKGTATNPVRTDPTGTTAQPISGSVAVSNLPASQPVTNAGTFAVQDSAAEASLVTIVGAISGGNTQDNIAKWGGTATSLGSKVSASSVPVVVASDQAAIPVSGSVNITGNPADNIAQWGGTAVTAPPATNTPATGSEVAPVVKSLQRKNQIVVLSGAYTNGVTTSTAWIDTQVTGDSWASIAGAILTGGGSSSISLQQCNDTANVNTFQTIQTTALVSLNTYYAASGAITNRYWRANFIGGSVSGTCDFYATSGSMSEIASVNGQVSYSGVTYLPVTIAQGQLSEGAAVDGCVNVAGSAGLALASANMVWTSGTNSDTHFLRTPAIFKTASVSATASGNTAVWTPTSGKKFRLMCFQITAQGLSATAATVLTISFQDASTGISIGTYDVLLPAVANLQAGITIVSDWVNLGNGYISTAANNVLNANISATVAGATGTFRVNVCGTEE